MTSNSIKAFFKKEYVFVIALVVAIMSMFFYAPSVEYLEYLDWRVLCMLMCLMLTVEGFKQEGLFDKITHKLLGVAKSCRSLVLILVALPFFASMLITNDVALIAFVPFSIAMLSAINQKQLIIPVVVLQTVAANTGCMMTPIGSPHNLFLFSQYEMKLEVFVLSVLPILAVAFVMLFVGCLVFSRREKAIKLPEPKTEQKQKTERKSVIHYVMLAVTFVLCVLGVIRVVDYRLITALVLACILIINYKLFASIDWFLLLTFICFFIFSGNIGNIEQVRSAVSTIAQENTFLCSVGLCQITSNVPAAIMLSEFTDNWKELLLGINVGGLGTPIASLASLISLKEYMKYKSAKVGRFMAVFLCVNVVFLIVLGVLAVVITQIQ